METRQGELRMQALQTPSEFAGKYCNAQVEIAIPLLVHSHALADEYKEEFFCERTSMSIGTQALSFCLAYGTQASRGNWQARRRIRIGR